MRHRHKCDGSVPANYLMREVRINEMDDGAPALPGNCSFGQLTDNGYKTMSKLGKSLRER